MGLIVNRYVGVFLCVRDPVNAADRAGLLTNDAVKSILHGEYAKTLAVMKNRRFTTRCGTTVIV